MQICYYNMFLRKLIWMSIHAVSFKQITPATPLDPNPAQLAQYFLVIWLLNLVCLFKCLLVLLLLILFSAPNHCPFSLSFLHMTGWHLMEQESIHYHTQLIFLFWNRDMHWSNWFPLLVFKLNGPIASYMRDWRPAFIGKALFLSWNENWNFCRY